jgi:FkbM family methyltransferase
MFRIIGAKMALKQAIARNRRSTVMMALHKAASFIESAWNNEGSSFDVNGERFVIERLAPAGFQRAFDVGANTGHWSHAALTVWPHCHVHAFEVAPATHQELATSSAFAAYSGRATFHDFGLSDTAGSLQMYYFPGHSELTSVNLRHEQHVAIPFDARLTTLDVFCRDQNIESIDFLKIDVEGTEHRVLKGGRALLEAQKVACIQFEYGAFSIGSHFLLKDFFDLLSSHYFIGKIFPNYVAFGDYDWRDENFRFSNYLCIAKTRPDLRALIER